MIFDPLYDDDDGCLGSLYDDQDYSVACREFDCQKFIISFAPYDYSSVRCSDTTIICFFCTTIVAYDAAMQRTMQCMMYR